MPFALRSSSRRHPLVREVCIVLAIKTLLLFLGSRFFFGPDTQLHVTPAMMQRQLLPEPTSNAISPRAGAQP